MTKKAHDWTAEDPPSSMLGQPLIIGDFLDFHALEDGQIKLTPGICVI